MARLAGLSPQSPHLPGPGPTGRILSDRAGPCITRAIAQKRSVPLIMRIAMRCRCAGWPVERVKPLALSALSKAPVMHAQLDGRFGKGSIRSSSSKPRKSDKIRNRRLTPAYTSCLRVCSPAAHQCTATQQQCGLFLSQSSLSSVGATSSLQRPNVTRSS